MLSAEALENAKRQGAADFNVQGQVFDHLTKASVAYAQIAADHLDLEEFDRRIDALRQVALARNGKSETAAGVITTPQKKTIFHVGVPYLHSVEWHTAIRLFMQAIDFDKYDWRTHWKDGSLIAHSFNELYSMAWNDPAGCDWFILFHADVRPSVDEWITTGIELAEKSGLDVLHATVAIRDPRGMTSTAIGLSGHDWSPVRCVSMMELHDLPEVFTLPDVVAAMKWHPDEREFRDSKQLCLLPNTGVLFVRMSAVRKIFPGFQVLDRLVILDGDNTLHPMPTDVEGLLCAHVVPEDWNFGRWCARNGLKVGGTNVMGVAHIGKNEWPTHEPWGQQTRDDFFEKRMKVWKGGY